MARKADNGDGKPSSTMGYFRVIFQKNPRLLKTRSNEEVLKLWLADNPGQKQVPQKVKSTLANLKSLMRRKLRKRGSSNLQGLAEDGFGPPRRSTKAKVSSLETLEIQIDDCLTLARTLDREGLDNIIRHLRRARNEVVWMIGQ